MSIIARIPGNALVREPFARFDGPYNPAIGGYDYNQAANTDVDILQLNAGSLYVIALISFYAATDAGNWLTGVQGSTSIPEIRFRYKNSSATTLFPEPIKLANYRIAEERTIFFLPSAGADALQITMAGYIDQPAALVGVPSLAAQANFTIYEISNTAYIDQFLQLTGQTETQRL